VLPFPSLHLGKEKGRLGDLEAKMREGSGRNKGSRIKNESKFRVYNPTKHCGIVSLVF